MAAFPHRLRIALAALLGVVAGAGAVWWLPAARRTTAPPPAPTADTELVQQLLAEHLGARRFPFPTVVRACSGRAVLPLDPANPAHARIVRALDEALATLCADLGKPGSPVRSLRRINEASRFFEDGLREHLEARPGLHCESPPNRRGDHQRTGYPDLRLVDETSGCVFYLDPKLVEHDAWTSTLRTFYFEPKDQTLKLADDAVHLLIGISHDGRDGAWSFGPWRIADLSTARVRLKAEFHASNADLYPAPPESDN
jgi:hypothetical protein